jgi:dipeptidyl aminopeptidase/acylaminoacyl peptidase
MKHPVTDRAARRVVYENWNYDINIGRIGRVGQLGRVGQVGQVVSVENVTRTSELWNLYPQISPDDERLAYVSTQSGSHELWIAGRDGANARQLTRFAAGVVKMPRWSPDGGRIVFLARGMRSVDVHVVDVATGAVTAVTSDAKHEVAPAWSTDGNRILFGAAGDDGTWHVWSVDAAKPDDVRIEIRHAVAAQASADGSALYFTRPDQRGLWRIRANAEHTTNGSRWAGTAERVIGDIEPGNTQSWNVARDAIYFVRDRDDAVRLKRVALSGGDITEVATLEQFTWPGFSISRDGSVLYAKWDRRDSNLMSIEY